MPSSTGKSVLIRRNVSMSEQTTSLVGGKDKDVGARIRRIPTIHQKYEAGESSSSNIPASTESIGITKLEESLLIFGPLYRNLPDNQGHQASEAIKENAWNHVLDKSKDQNNGPEKIKEIYLFAMRNVEAAAKEMYAGIEISSEGIDFLSMMLMDGCFFLQLALTILGCSEDLGYPNNDLIFGEPQQQNLKKWIEAMFCVGNQIPFVVLKELMNQKYFKDVIDKARWDPPPSGLCKVVLYNVLFLNQGRRRRRRSLIERVVTRRGGKDAPEQGQQNEPCDLLHGFRNYLMGPNHHLTSDFKADDQVDVEANDDESTGNFKRVVFPDDTPSTADSKSCIRDILNALGFLGAVDNRRRIFPSATEMKQQGIHIKKLKSGGARGIYYKSYYFWACLYLPAFPLDGDAEVMLRNLKKYDNFQLQAGQNGREVSSYLRFMSDLIQTRRDAKLLQKKGIIQGEPDDVDELPAMLNRLSAEDIRLTQKLRMLRTQIRDYSSPWNHYKGVINVVAILTFIQTFFAMIAYIKPPKQKTT